MTKFYDQRPDYAGDVYLLHDGRLFKTPIGEPVGLSEKDAGRIAEVKTSGFSEDFCFLCDEGGQLETVLISENRLTVLRRRLEDRVRKDKPALLHVLASCRYLNIE